MPQYKTEIYRWTVRCSSDLLLGRAEVSGSGTLDVVKITLGTYLEDMKERSPASAIAVNRVQGSLHRTDGYHWYQQFNCRVGDQLAEISVLIEPAESAASPAPVTVRKRAGDSDREPYYEQVRQAYAEGRLLSEEVDTRMDLISATRYIEDLPALTADLPEPPVPAVREPGYPLAIGARRTGVNLIGAYLLLGVGLIVNGFDLLSLSSPGSKVSRAAVLVLMLLALVLVVREMQAKKKK